MLHTLSGFFVQVIKYHMAKWVSDQVVMQSTYIMKTEKMTRLLIVQGIYILLTYCLPMHMMQKCNFILPNIVV